jgi:hypothetical protein
VEDGVPAPPRRWRLRVAIAATLVAVPLLLLDNLTEDDGDGAPPTELPRPLDTVAVPLDRPQTGPAKGISVVTTSTTASTVPITAATTTTRR